MRNFGIVLILVLIYLLFGFSHASELTAEQQLLEKIESLDISNSNEIKRLIEIAASNQKISQSDSLQSHLLNLIARQALIDRQYNLAAIKLQQARQLANQSGNQLQLAESMRREGILLTAIHQFAEALSLFNQATEIYIEINSPKVVNALESSLNLYLRLKMTDELKQYGHMQLEEAIKRSLPLQISSGHFFLSEAYILENNIEKASYHSAALASLALTTGNKYFEIKSYRMLAKVEAATGNTSEALKSINTAISIIKDIKLLMYLPSYMLIKADILLSVNQTIEAKKILEEVIDIAIDKTYTLKALKMLSQLYEGQSDYKSALFYANKYEALRKINSQETQQQLMAISRAKLDVTFKENQIKELIFKRELSNQQQKNQWVIIIVSGFALIILSIFSITVYRQKHKIKETYKALEQASAAKSQFLARMSHEIRTPINAIVGLTKLSLKASPDEQQLVNLKQIEESSQTLLVVINDILDFSKIEAGELHLSEIPFDIEEAITRAIRLNSIKAIEKNIALTHSISRDIPLRLIGDPQRLQQVLNNLLSNAIKFTETGSVKVSVKRKYDGTHLLLAFEVKDTGVGIDPSQQAHLFDSFSQADESITREYGGTGLGLAICKQLVQLMGGDIWLNSSPNKGTSVFFTIKSKETEHASPTRLTSDSIANLRVLIIDDLAISRQSMQETLHSVNVNCDQAIDGSEGIMKFRRAINNDVPYDLILLDWRLKDINSIEVASIIRQECIDNPPIIIMLSSIDTPQMRSLGNAVGINLYLRKPLNSKSLIDAILGTASQRIAQTAPVSTDFQAPNLIGKHILLVEDNSINRKVAQAYLKDTFAKISVSENGKKALEKLAEDNSISLVLMDIQMPVMDGFSATKIIREDLKLELPIIAMTAHAMTEEIKKSFEIGMNAHVSKPIDPNLLYQTIQKLLEEYATTEVTQDSALNIELDPSQLKESLVSIDKPRAVKVLLNDENVYRELVGDFISMYNDNQIPDAIESLEDLSSIKELVHTIRPPLTYIGLYKLANFVDVLEKELISAKLPIQENLRIRIELFKSSLDTIVEKRLKL